MTLTYAIPDIHGRLDLFDAAIDAIENHATGQCATIVTLGDYIDRGPDSRRVIERLMNWRSINASLPGMVSERYMNACLNNL